MKFTYSSRHQKVLAFCLTILIPLQMKAAEMWIGANTTSADYFNFFRSPEKVSKTLANAKFYKIYIDALNQSASPFSYNTEELASLGRMLTSKKIKVAIELGGPLGGSLCKAYTAGSGGIGIASAEIEFEKLLQFNSAVGHLPQALVLDGPISRIIKQGRSPECKLTLEQSVAELVSYMKKMKQLYATRKQSTQFHVLVNFPNWKYQKMPGSLTNWSNGLDYATVLEKMVKSTKTAGVAITGLQIDCPYDYLVKSGSKEKARLPLLAKQAKKLGLKVEVIFNSDRGLHWSINDPRPNNTSTAHSAPPKKYTQTHKSQDNRYWKDIQQYADFWMKSVGKPDIIVVQSWHKAPFYFAPENRIDSLSSNFVRLLDFLNKSTDRKVSSVEACSKQEYLRRRPDVKADAYYGSRPELHYVNHGQTEGMCDPR